MGGGGVGPRPEGGDEGPTWTARRSGGRDLWGGGAPLPCGAGGCAKQAHEGGPAAGAGRELGGVRDIAR